MGSLESWELKAHSVVHFEILRARGFPHSSVGKEINLQFRRPHFNSWIRKIRWRRERYALQYSWASLVASLVVKNLPAVQETWV